MLFYLLLDIQGNDNLYQDSDKEYLVCAILFHVAITLFFSPLTPLLLVHYVFFSFFLLRTVCLLLMLCSCRIDHGIRSSGFLY